MDLEHRQQDLAFAQCHRLVVPVAGPLDPAPLLERNLARFDRQRAPLARRIELVVELRAERQRAHAEQAFPHALMAGRRLRLEQPAMQRQLVAHHHPHRLVAQVPFLARPADVGGIGDEIVGLLRIRRAGIGRVVQLALLGVVVEPGDESHVAQRIGEHRVEAGARRVGSVPLVDHPGELAQVGLIPAQRIGGVRQASRHRHAALAEGFGQGDAEVELVFRNQVGIGGDHRAQVIAEGRRDGRQVIEPPHAHLEHRVRGLAGILREARDQLLGQVAAAARDARDPEQVVGAALVDGHERVEHRRHQALPAVVRLARPGDRLDGRGLDLLPPARLRRMLLLLQGLQRHAQRSAAPRGMSELAGQTVQQALRAQLPAGPRQLVPHHVLHREVLPQRHGVGEAFGNCQRVRIDRLAPAAPHAVKDRVRGLMSDDVLRQAGEDPLSLVPVGARPALEVAEQQRPLARAEIGVRLAQCVGVDAEPAREGGVVFLAPAATGPLLRFRPGIVVGQRPEHRPPERALEVADRVHGHREDHLLVELRVALGRRQTVLRQEPGMVGIERLIERAAMLVVIDDLEVFVRRSETDRVLPAGFPRQFDHRIVDDRRFQRDRSGGIERIDAHPPLARFVRTRVGQSMPRFMQFEYMRTRDRPLLTVVLNLFGRPHSADDKPNQPIRNNVL